VALMLRWPKRRPKDYEGRMTLGEHIAELRNRLIKSTLAIVAGSVVGWIEFEPLLGILRKPFDDGVVTLLRERGIEPQLTMTGIADPFTFQIKIALVFGLVLSSPIWLYQLWAFVVPGLHRSERKWALLFSAVAGPLFFGGIVVGYLTLPKAIEILLGFTPADVMNIPTLPGYLNFTLRLLLVFGVAFLIPLVVVMLNLAGVVRARALAKARPYIVLGAFVFAAVATPTGDPFTLMFLAVPMCVLFFAAEVIARLVDRRRTSREIAEFGEPLS
jgi:sec-independent protein translocase protein TatC